MYFYGTEIILNTELGLAIYVKPYPSFQIVNTCSKRRVLALVD